MTPLADLLSTIFDRRYKTTASVQLSSRPLPELAEELIGTAGETSGLALAEEILSRFETLGDDQKLAFFRHIATAMDISPHTVRKTLDTYERDPSKNTYRAFAEAAEPRRQELIRRLNRIPGATGQLVRLRAELLRLAAQEPQLAALDLDFRHLFTSWFNRGFLVLRLISWASPAHILEKIIIYEAVHAIASWEDLRRRLKPADRRCFTFFHPSNRCHNPIFQQVLARLSSRQHQSPICMLRLRKRPVTIRSNLMPAYGATEKSRCNRCPNDSFHLCIKDDTHPQRKSAIRPNRLRRGDLGSDLDTHNPKTFSNISCHGCAKNS